MAELILLLALMAVIFYYARKENKRKEYDHWVNSCRSYLVRVAHSFRRDCQEAADKAFAQYSSIMQHNRYPHADMRYMRYSFLEPYRKSLDALKEDYLKNVNARLKAEMPHCIFTSIPIVLLAEYNRLITDIYNTFYDFEWRMREQIMDKE